MNNLIKIIPRYKSGEVQNYSINRCLYELGAPKEEVFFGVDRDHAGYRNWNKRKHTRKKIRSYRSIYHMYDKDTLWNWAQNLYREKLIKWHPDKHLWNRTNTEQYCQYLGQVFDKTKKILHPKGYFGGGKK